MEANDLQFSIIETRVYHSQKPQCWTGSYRFTLIVSDISFIASQYKTKDANLPWLIECIWARRTLCTFRFWPNYSFSSTLLQCFLCVFQYKVILASWCVSGEPLPEIPAVRWKENYEAAIMYRHLSLWDALPFTNEVWSLLLSVAR